MTKIQPTHVQPFQQVNLGKTYVVFWLEAPYLPTRTNTPKKLTDI